MTLLALLISTDDSASEILGRTLPAAGIAVERFSDLTAAIDRLQQQRFDALILDYEDAKAAGEVFDEARRLNSGSAPVTVALVAEQARVRDILTGGVHFVLYKPLEIQAHGQVAWANPNGQTGVHFLDLDDSVKGHLQVWLLAAASVQRAGEEEIVPHCKLTDLSLGGCYVETDSPFPEHALVDLCLKTEEIAVHTEGMVRVTHPGRGMGVEFPSRTPEQRAQVGNLISLLRSFPASTPELSVSPRSLTADLSQFESAPEAASATAEEGDLEDPLLDLLRQAATMQQDAFLEELRRQRSGESVAT